jgi:hypothetical protein
MLSNITTTHVTVGGNEVMPFWKFWLRSDASRLFHQALAKEPRPTNLDLLGDASIPNFQPQKRYADWNIDFDQFAEGDWEIDPQSDIRWPWLKRASDGSMVQMSWDDFFLSVPAREVILKRLKNSGNADFYKRFVNARPLRSTLSVPEEEFNTLMMEYRNTAKKHRTDVVNRIVETQWVQSQDIPSLTDDPLAELRVRLLEH